MKKIIILALAAVMTTGALMAQKPVEVAERDVPSRTVVEFQNQMLDTRDVHWYRIDSITYEVQFTDGDDTQQGIRYSPRGTERRYYMEQRYCPQAIADYVKENYKGFQITEFCAREVRRKTTYDVRIARKGGFLFWRKEKEVKHLEFEPNGTFSREM